MSWSTISFGNKEIKGKTLPQIIFSDPSWFFWAYREGIFTGKGKLSAEADEISRKARNIKIPQAEGKERVSALYFVHPHTRDFDHIVISDENPEKDEPLIVKDRIDLNIPFEINCYDKKGGEILVDAVKNIYFQNKAGSKTMYEEFFDNNDNFLSASGIPSV